MNSEERKILSYKNLLNKGLWNIHCLTNHLLLNLAPTLMIAEVNLPKT